MVCIKCGAELRPQARFCNACGTVQPDAESADGQPSRPVATAEQPTTTVADADGQASDGSGKQKRPARILRHRDDESSLTSLTTRTTPRRSLRQPRRGR